MYSLYKSRFYFEGKAQKCVFFFFGMVIDLIRNATRYRQVITQIFLKPKQERLKSVGFDCIKTLEILPLKKKRHLMTSKANKHVCISAHNGNTTTTTTTITKHAPNYNWSNEGEKIGIWNTSKSQAQFSLSWLESKHWIAVEIGAHVKCKNNTNTFVAKKMVSISSIFKCVKNVLVLYIGLWLGE